MNFKNNGKIYYATIGFIIGALTVIGCVILSEYGM